MRVLDVLIAFPALVLALVIAEGLGPSELHTIWALSFFASRPSPGCRAAATLRLREQTFIARRAAVRHRRPAHGAAPRRAQHRCRS